MVSQVTNYSEANECKNGNDQPRQKVLQWTMTERQEMTFNVFAALGIMTPMSYVRSDFLMCL